METADRSRISLRLPTRMRDWLSQQARINGHGMNAEIVRLVRERMQVAAGEEFGDATPAAAQRSGRLAPAGNING